MPKHEAYDDKRELIMHTLEGAALASLLGFAAKRMLRDKRLQGTRVEPGDIVHTVVAKAIERAEQFRGEAEPETWLGSMVMHQVQDEGDRIYLQREVAPGDFEHEIDKGHPDPERIVVDESVSDQMNEDFSHLSPSEKTVLWLHHIYGWSYEEISEHLKMNVNTAKSHAKRGRDVLRKLIEDRKAA